MATTMVCLVESTAKGTVSASSEALRFVDAAAAAICEVLTVGARTFSLMPYRHGYSAEFLCFNWKDEGNHHITFSFSVGEDRTVLPNNFFVSGTDVLVKDATDALLLIRLISQKVNGSSLGVI